MKFIIFIITFYFLALSLPNGLLFTFSLPVNAANIPAYPAPQEQGTIISNVANSLKAIGDPFVYKDVGTLVSYVLSWGLIAASLLTVLFLLWGGIQWIISGGDKNALESARNRITGALMGIAVVAAVWALFAVVKWALGLPINMGSKSGSTGTGGETTTASYNGDCCTIISGNEVRPYECCDLTSRLGYLKISRSQSDPKACQGEIIDWGKWSSDYTKLVAEGKLNPSSDPCQKKP